METDDSAEILFTQTYNAGKIGLLSSVTQVHDGNILGAINEFQDNAIEAHAKNQWIRLDEDESFGYMRILSFVDDGCGLDKRSWSRLLALGDIKGDNNYGVGCKTGSFSIGKGVLIFSKGQDHGDPLWGVAYFRNGCPHGKHCLQCGRWKTNFVPPVVYWREDGSAITSENHDRGAGGAGGMTSASRRRPMDLSTEGVAVVLGEIFKNSLIKSIKGIQAQFKKIRSKTGTLILISDLPDQNAKDIEGRVLAVNSEQAANPDIQVHSQGDAPFMRSRVGFAPGSDIPADYSLRAQLELLLRPVDGGERGMIKFHIQGQEVQPQVVESMCQYGGMKNFDFGLDPKNNATSFDLGIHKVRCKLGFSPEAFDKELGGLFFYYDKGNGDPLRLVQSYQLKEGVHIEVYAGMVGVVIVEALPDGQKAKHGEDGITMHNGKQKFNPSNVLTAMQSKCFDLMLDYLPQELEFSGHREAYRKSEASSMWVHSLVWVKPGKENWSKNLSWWPGKILNRYDSQTVRPVPTEVLCASESKDRDALLIFLFEEEVNPYFWCKHKEIKTNLEPFKSDKGRSIEKESKNYSESEVVAKRLHRAMKKAEAYLKSTHVPTFFGEVQCFRCAAWRKAQFCEGDVEGKREWQCSKGYFERDEELRVCRTGVASQNVESAGPVADGLEEVQISALISTSSSYVGLIGTGVHGAVHRVQWEGEDWAAKVYHGDPNSKVFSREIRALKALQQTAHPNIVTLRAVEFRGPEPAILMEFCEMNMQQAVKKKAFSYSQLLTFGLHISRGMTRMHSLNLAHGDLKPENILLRLQDSGYTAKISDYGLAKLPGSSSAGTGGDTYLKAPEFWLIEKTEKSLFEYCAADIFAVGWIYLEMLAMMQTSWREKESHQLKTLYGGLGNEIGDIELLDSNISDPEVKALIKTCWARIPTKRPKFKQQEEILQAIASRTDSLQGEELRIFEKCHSTTLVYRVLDDNDIQCLCDGKGILSRAAHNRVQGDVVRTISRNELESHISKGRNGANESRCISTSRSKEWCMWYVHKKHHLRDDNTLRRSKDFSWYPVVEIDLSKINDVLFIDVSTTTLCEEKLEVKMNRYFAQDAKEVILLSDIPVSAITNWYELDLKGPLGQHISKVQPNLVPAGNIKQIVKTAERDCCEKERTHFKFEGFAIWKEAFSRQKDLNLKNEKLFGECKNWANEIRLVSEEKKVVQQSIQKTALFKVFKALNHGGESSGGKSLSSKVSGGGEGGSRPNSKDDSKHRKHIASTQIAKTKGKADIDNDEKMASESDEDAPLSRKIKQTSSQHSSSLPAAAEVAGAAGSAVQAAIPCAVECCSAGALVEEEISFPAATSGAASANLPLQHLSTADMKASKTPQQHDEKRKRDDRKKPADSGATHRISTVTYSVDDAQPCKALVLTPNTQIHRSDT